MSLPHPELRVEIRKSGNKYFAVTKQENGREICTNEFQHDPTGTTHLGPLWLLERGTLSPDDTPGRGVSSGGKASVEQVALYGQRLYGYLFGKGKPLQAFLKANPDYRQAHLILSLHPDVASLWRLPWEYIHDGEDFVCLNGTLRLSRRPEELLPLSLPAVAPPLRVLFVIAAPEDQKALDVERELAVVQDALEEHVRAGRLVMDGLDEPTLLALQDTLGRRPYHIVHYIGHGTYTPKQQRGFLCFEQRDGGTELADAEHLRPMLSSATQLRLFVVTACQSAQIGVLDAFDNVATGLLQFGIPAVLTVPSSLTDDSAIALFNTFYGQLVEGQSPVESLYRARLALKEVDDGRPAGHRRFDWGVPALYLRAQDTRLIDPALEAVGKVTAPTWIRNVAGLALPHHFVDRRNELHALRHAQREFIHVLALWGSDGIGKSALAAEFIAYSGISAGDVLVIGCHELFEPVIALEKIAAFWRAHQSEAHTQAAALLLDSRRDPGERARMAARMVGDYPAIIVFDDLDAWFESPPTAAEAAPASIADKIMDSILRGLISVRGKATYLFTANRIWEAVAAMPVTHKLEIHVPPLTPRQAVLLMNTLPHIGRESLTAKLDVYRLLGGHPETLKLLDGWLATGHHLQDIRDNPPITPQATEAWQQYFLDAILKRLDPGETNALLTMAVFEGPFNVDVVTRLTHVAEKYAEPLLVRWEKLALLHLHHLENRSPWYNFHPRVRDHILETVSDLERAGLYAQIAAYYSAPFLDEARRRIMTSSTASWPEARIEWLARDSNGILGMWIRQTQNPEHARRAMADALAWQHYLFKAGEYEAAAHIVRTIVPVLNRWGQHDLSEALLQRSIAVSAGPERAPSMDNLATLYLDRGHLGQALSVYEEVYAMLEKQGAKEQMAHILRRIAGAYQQSGDTSQAVEKYEAALRMMREIGDRSGEALCLHQLAGLYRQMEAYQRALACSQAAQNIYEKLGNRAGVAATLYEQAVSLKHTDHPEQALGCLYKSFEIARDIGEETLAVNVLEEIRALHRDSGQLDSATEATLKLLTG
ncbi:MAG TPA: CHAT domain-containing protein [Anaerolineae bacterium]|nr:CHAT domain-containing protein [Anaerolineae bacterium]